MRKFESSQKDESRAQSADSLKAYRQPRVLFVLTDVITEDQTVATSPQTKGQFVCHCFGD